MITASEIEHIARATARRPIELDADLVLAVIRESQRIAPTLFTAWIHDGRAITPVMGGVVEEEAARQERTRRITERVVREHPQAVILKGQSIADMYPAGVLRETRDLDLFLPSLTELWDAARSLIADRFHVMALTLRQVDGAAHALLSLERIIDRLRWPEHVELTTLMLSGNIRDVPATPLIQVSSAVTRNIVLLLEERFQRSFIARDLVDATILLRSISPCDGDEFVTTIGQLELAPELAELVTRLDALGLLQADVPAKLMPPDLIERSQRERRKRRWGRSLTLTGLVAMGQAQMLSGRLGRVRRTLWRRAIAATSGERLWRSGVAFFGAATDRATADSFELRLARRTPYASAETPIGSFILSPSGEIPVDSVW